jgi:undecaprenyl-diphosphatase
MNYIQAIIIAIVEGLTEFLPVSSTGHMIITSALMGIENDKFTKLFEIVIQFGAILSVVALYWKRFFQSFDFYLKLLVGFLPAAFFGFLLDDYIEAALGSVSMVAFSLLVGGIVLVFVDKWFAKNELTDASKPAEDLSFQNALVVGCFQVIAMIPGVSRSAATIIGGLQQGLTRQKAAEFSFFLAVPTMFAASAYKTLKFVKSGYSLQTEELSLLALGCVVAFVVAFLAIKSFIGFLTKYGFKIFGYYRIVVGALLLLLEKVFQVPMNLF